ncbi:hypothetical protein [Pontitalea aquivivens]|uniref:hypothetical protein n=1 Tax=Pontitalea aquivivens TaxID=3388663 RepID=UPI00397109F4
MHQSIEKKRETIGGLRVVTVMFRDRRGVRAISDSFRAREIAAQSLSVPLTGFSVVAPASSLPRTLNAYDLTDFARRRTRRRAAPSICKFSAEEPVALSASAVFAVNPNKRGTQAAKNETTTMTEQRRCAAA